MSDSVTAWTIAHQALLSIGFSRQEFWNGLPFPSPGDLHDPRIKLGSPTLQVDYLLLSHWEALYESTYQEKGIH